MQLIIWSMLIRKEQKWGICHQLARIAKSDWVSKVWLPPVPLFISAAADLSGLRRLPLRPSPPKTSSPTGTRGRQNQFMIMADGETSMSSGDNPSMNDGKFPSRETSMAGGDNKTMADENPNMGDGQMSKDQKNVPHFCRIETIKSHVHSFTEDQRDLVNELGAGFVFSLGSSEPLIPSLTKFVVDNFSWEKQSLEIEEGVFLPIKTSVKEMYNLSDTGIDLTHSGQAKYNAIPYVKESRFKYLINKSIQDLWDTVRKSNGEDFCILFMLALLNTLLAPSRSTKVDTSFLVDLVDKENIKRLNLCAFVTKYLINGIKAYKLHQAKHVVGCLHLLHLICADYFGDKAQSTVFPRSNHIKYANLKHAATEVSHASLKNRKSADNIQSESMNSSRNFGNKKSPARKIVSQKTNARALQVLDVTNKIMSSLQHYMGVETDDVIILGEGTKHSSHGEDPNVMSSNIHGEDQEVMSSPVRVEGADNSGPVHSSRGEDPNIMSSNIHGEDHRDMSSPVRMEGGGHQVTPSPVRVEAAQPVNPEAKRRRRGALLRSMVPVRFSERIRQVTSSHVQVDKAAQTLNPKAKLPRRGLQSRAEPPVLRTESKRKYPDFLDQAPPDQGKRNQKKGK